ncbi:hypothetical protein BC833DRAFT_591656 [Globomyces pollinis-pini]|nr:hypothetical protein BC833DRAFT_591656 [Globomyces pollinis-pini]
MENALVEWFNLFSGSDPIRSLSDLSDGQLIATVLNEVDPSWFKKLRTIESANWVMKFNNLKRLLKLTMGYFEEVLRQKTNHLPHPDLTLIAKESNELEIIKFGSLVLTLAVQSAENQSFIEKIQTLKQESQTHLMVAIESMIKNLSSNDATSNGSTSPIDTPITDSESSILKRENLILLERIRELEQRVSNMATEGNMDSAVKNEMLKYQGQIEKVEQEKHVLEETVRKQNLKLHTLNEKLDEVNVDKDQTMRLKAQLDEFKSVADKLQKAEALVDKYKKKIDESSELKQSFKVMEEQLALETKKNESLEEQFQKVAGLKPLIDTYKSQISALEERNSQLHVELVNLDFQSKESRTKIKRHEADNELNLEKIMELEDALKDAELNIAVANSGGNDVSNAKIEQLELEIAALRKQKADFTKQLNRVVVLENLLEDANVLKSKFQEDYQKVYTTNLQLSNENEQLKSVPQGDASHELIFKLNQANKELMKMKSETDMKRSSSVSIRDSTRDSLVASEKGRQLLDENRKLNARIQKLEGEKALAENGLNDLQTRFHELEKNANSLKASLAVLDSTNGSTDETTKSLVTATQKLGQFNDQNTHLHTALKQAKELILSQDKKIKELVQAGTTENFAEAINSLESTLRIREAELDRSRQELQDTRAAARREQRLIMSAWYELGIQFQQRANTNAPTSWLAQQRQQMNENARKR